MELTLPVNTIVGDGGDLFCAVHKKALREYWSDRLDCEQCIEDAFCTCGMFNTHRCQVHENGNIGLTESVILKLKKRDKNYDA